MPRGNYERQPDRARNPGQRPNCAAHYAGRLEANIASERYFTAGDGVHGDALRDPANEGRSVYESSLDLLTFCVLVLKNGFTVTGESACASPENFDAEIGRKIARQNAITKVWPLMGYELKQHLHDSK